MWADILELSDKRVTGGLNECAASAFYSDRLCKFISDFK